MKNMRVALLCFFSSAFAHGNVNAFELGQYLNSVPPQAIGFYSQGSLENSDNMPEERHGFLKVFRPRNNGWSTVDLENIVSESAEAIAVQFPTGERLQIADMSAKGGKQLGGHISHQNGLDADIIYYRMNHRELDPINAVAMDEDFVSGNQVTANFDFRRNWEVVKFLHGSGRIKYIFMDQVIKNGLCDYAESINELQQNADLFRHLLHVDGHKNHMHVRITCPATSPQCIQQAEPPPTNGCHGVRFQLPTEETD